MPKERIRKLAKRLSRSPEEIIATLEDLGHTKYHNPSDMLPEDVVTEVTSRLKRASGRTGAGRQARLNSASPPNIERPVADRSFSLPDAYPDDPALTAALEDYLKASPLAAMKQKAARARAIKPSEPPHRRSNEPAPPRPAESTEDMLRDSLGAEIRKRRQLADTLDQMTDAFNRLKSEAMGREAALKQEIAALRQQLEAQARERAEERTRFERVRKELQESLGERVTLLERELHDTAASDRESREALEVASHNVESLKQDLANLRVRLAEEVVARQVAEARVERLERKLHDVREQAAREPSPSPVPSPSPPPGHDIQAVPLDEVFEARGLRTSEEVRSVFALLLRDKFYYDTMELLATVSPAAFRRALERRIALVCENCNPPEGKYPIRVEDDERCEVCHGRSLEDGVETFLSACRASGIQRVNLVGGPPRGRQRVAELLAKHIEVRLLEQPLTVPEDWLRGVAEDADLTVLWGDSFLDHRVTAQFQALGDERMVHVSHPGPGGMLVAAARDIKLVHPSDSLFDDKRS